MENTTPKKTNGDSIPNNETKTHQTIQNSPKIKIILNKILEENSERSSQFENLPKIVLSKVMIYLRLSDMAKMWRVNKYFFKLITDSFVANVVWKHHAKMQLNFENEEELEKLIETDENSQNKSEYENKLNRYCFFLKHGFKLKWDTNKKGPHISLVNDYLIETGKKKNLKK